MSYLKGIMKCSKKVGFRRCFDFTVVIQNLRSINSEALEFPELPVKNLWETWKENRTIKKYIPDYKESKLPKRSFLLGIVGTLYKEELEGVIKAAYKHQNK